MKNATIAALRPIDDILFNLMYEDRLACQELVQTILNDTDLCVKNVIAQNTIANLQGRGVRLDIACETTSGRLVNIEVQRANNDDHFRRIRYNASAITAKHTPKSVLFRDVAEVYLIYIAEFPIVKAGRTVYHNSHTSLKQCSLLMTAYIA